MQAKYCPNRSFLVASLGYAGSYSWSSIWSAKALIKEGVFLRVGDGESVNIWSDPWLIGEVGRFVTTLRVEGLNKVSDLINSLSMDWKVELIMHHFNEIDQKRILSIPLSFRGPKDSLASAYSKDGLYSTKTAYMLRKGGDIDMFHKAWMGIWSMNIAEGQTFLVAVMLEHTPYSSSPQTSTHAGCCYLSLVW